MFVRSLELKFLTQSCLLNDKFYPPPMFLTVALFSWIKQLPGGLLRVDFSMRLVAWTAANWMLSFCIQFMMLSSFV